MTTVEELPPDLERVDPESFEVERRKHGKGFAFRLRADGRRVEDARALDYLKSIPVPHTWTDVRLSLNPKAYIRATGYDGSAKHQYLYHDDYLEYRNEKKFAELFDFGLTLPRIRRHQRLHPRSLTRELHRAHVP